MALYARRRASVRAESSKIEKVSIFGGGAGVEARNVNAPRAINVFDLRASARARLYKVMRALGKQTYRSRRRPARVDARSLNGPSLMHFPPTKLPEHFDLA